MHRRGMLRPLWEFVCVHRKVFGKLLDDGGVFKEENLNPISAEFRHISDDQEDLTVP